MSIKKPEFFIVGAPKCGTTTLYNWLKGHPDIFMPEEKEPHYFARHLSDRYCRVRTEEDYLKQFSRAKSRQMCGEASVLYGFFPESIQQILEFNPQAKIIFMIRSPVEMAISYHGQLLGNLEEDEKDFDKAWALQESRAEGKNYPKHATDPQLLQYYRFCVLGEHLKNIMAMVPENQRKIILLQDLARHPAETYHDVLSFLKLWDDGRTNFVRANEATVIRSVYLQKLRTMNSGWAKILRRFLKMILPPVLTENFNRRKRIGDKISGTTKENLLKLFDSDIALTESLLNRNLSQWRTRR